MSSYNLERGDMICNVTAGHFSNHLIGYCAGFTERQSLLSTSLPKQVYENIK